MSPFREGWRASRATWTSTPCWITRACAAPSAAGATPTARGSASRSGATSRGPTTTEGAGWPAGSSCPATGGWHASWVWCRHPPPPHLSPGLKKVGRGGRDGRGCEGGEMKGKRFASHFLYIPVGQSRSVEKRAASVAVPTHYKCMEQNLGHRDLTYKGLQSLSTAQLLLLKKHTCFPVRSSLTTARHAVGRTYSRPVFTESCAQQHNMYL